MSDDMDTEHFIKMGALHVGKKDRTASNAANHSKTSKIKLLEIEKSLMIRELEEQKALNKAMKKRNRDTIMISSKVSATT